VGFLLDKTPKKFEDEETRRKIGGRVREGRGQRANLTLSPSSIAAHLHPYSEATSLVTLFLFSTAFYHSSSHSDFERVACLFLSLLPYSLSSRFSFPLFGVLVFSSSLCSVTTFPHLTLSIH